MAATTKPPPSAPIDPKPPKKKNGKTRKAKKAKAAAKPRKMKIENLLPPVMRVSTTPLGRCLKDYIQAAANPFSAPPACLPHSPSRDSTKRRMFYKGTAVVGSGGFGYVVATTQLARDATNGTGYTRAWYASTAAYPDVYLPPGMATGIIDVPGGASGVLNTPYTATSLTNGEAEGRTVALGVRVRYLGSEQDRNGRLVAFEHPSHLAVDNYTIGDCLQYGFSESVPNNRQWVVALWQHKKQDELEYGPKITPVPSLAILIDGTPGDKYEFEVFHHAETVNKTGVNNGIETLTPVDDGLFSAINQLMAQTLTSAQDAFSTLTTKELSSYASEILKVAYTGSQIYTGGRHLMVQY
jgi:hypothetical protein